MVLFRGYGYTYFIAGVAGNKAFFIQNSRSPFDVHTLNPNSILCWCTASSLSV